VFEVSVKVKLNGGFNVSEVLIRSINKVLSVGLHEPLLRGQKLLINTETVLFFVVLLKAGEIKSAVPNQPLLLLIVNKRIVL